MNLIAPQLPSGKLTTIEDHFAELESLFTRL